MSGKFEMDLFSDEFRESKNRKLVRPRRVNSDIDG